MSAVTFTNKIRYLDNEYLFQTAVNEHENQVVCSLFNRGRLIDRQSTSINGESDRPEIIEFVKNIHERNLANYSALLRVVESKRDCGRADVVVKLGTALFSRKMYDEAIELLSSAAETFPDNSTIKMLLGKIHYYMEDFSQAEFQLTRAVELSPDYPDYRNLLGATLLKLNKPVAAIGQFQQAIAMNIYYDKAYFNLGLGYVLNNIVKEDFELAKDPSDKCGEAFEKAVTFNPAYLNEDYKLGREYLRQERFEEAYGKLQSVLESGDNGNSGDKLLEMYLRYIYGGNGVSERGFNNYIEHMESLLKSNPDYADLQNELGMAYTILGKFMRDKAMIHFQKAVEINPRFKKAIKNIRLSENDLKGYEVLLEAILK